MYGYELDNLLNFHSHYLGNFSHDKIPTLTNKPFSLIVNYHNSNQPGSHWVALFHHPKQQYVKFFDSYGLPPSNIIQYKCRQYLNNKKILYSTSRIQHNLSTYCGLYCVYFINLCDEGVSYYDILYQFNPNGSFNNDKLLEDKLLND